LTRHGTIGWFWPGSIGPTPVAGGANCQNPTVSETTPARTPPGPHTLRWLIGPVIFLVICSNVANLMWATLHEDHPLLLIALSSINRYLILVSGELDALSYYGVGTMRLLVSDPLFFLLGYWYGDAAVHWMEKRTRTFGDTLRQIERWFGKAAYPLVFLMPNNYICLFAGAAGMSVVGFFVANITGTLVRLYLIRRVGEAFEAPIDGVLDFLGEYRIPLLVLSIVLVGVFSLIELRRGDSEVDALLKLDDDLGLVDEPDPPRSTPPSDG
jgi:membrane protein DedA with SNARE-associated domain